MGTATPRAPLDSLSLRALEFCPDAIVVTMGELDPTGPTIIFVNKAFERLTGYRRSEVWGKTPWFLLGREDETTALDPLWGALRAGEDFHGELTQHRRDGTSFVADWKVSPIRDAEGSITHWIAVKREVRGARPCPECAAAGTEEQDPERQRTGAAAGRGYRLAIASLEVGRVTVEPEAALMPTLQPPPTPLASAPSLADAAVLA